MPMSHYFNARNLQWCIWSVFCLGILLFFPGLSFADTCPNGVCVNTGNSAIFTPSPSDQSIIYLGELFGNIPPVLAGTGSSIMGKLFSTLNTGALTLAVIIAGYTTFVGIMNTAGEGEMLGKNWNSIWVPIRSIAGIALLIPTASGYCVCQIFMAWLLVQGVGLADSLTNTVVTYMYQGEKIFVAGDMNNGQEFSTFNNTVQANNDGQKYSQYDTMIKNIYQGLACVQAYQKAYPDVNTGYLSPPLPTLDNQTNPTMISYHFVANSSSTTVDPTTGQEKVVPVSQSCGYINIRGVTSLNAQIMEDAMAAIMPSLNAAAYFMVNDLTTADFPSQAAQDQAIQDTFNFVGADFLTEVEKAYHSYVTQAENITNSGDKSNNKNYEDIKAYGWTALGTLFWDMAESYGTTGSVKFNSTWDTNQPPYIGYLTNDNSYPDLVWEYAGGGTYANPDGSSNALTGWATQFMDDLIKTRDSGNTNSNQLQKNYNSGKFSTTGTIAAIASDTLDSMLDKFNQKKNPMIIAQELGHDITYDIEVVYTTIQVLMGAVAASFFALGVAGQWLTIGSLLAAVAAVSLALITVFPGLFAFMGTMLALGGTLAVVIPFIPMLAYFLAIMAWLISALETIVAAPIVAIGVLHPDGQHPVLGKAEPAIMLMVNMFLRPSLLVLGFVAGIILSSISIQFINLGFSSAVDHLLNNGGDDTVSGVEIMLFMATYVALVFACVNKSFSVIEALPNTIMRWIGHEGARFDSGQDAMQKIQGSQEGAGQKSADSSTQSGEASTHQPEKAHQTKKSLDAESDATNKNEKELNNPGSGGTGT